MKMIGSTPPDRIMSLSLHDEMPDAFRMLKAPDRISVSDFSRTLKIDTPGGYCGPYTHEITPYFEEPMRCMSDRKYTTVCFVGSSQTGKTQSLVTNPICHNIVCDPHDSLVVQTTETIAKDYSERVLSRMIQVNPEVRDRIKTTLGNQTYKKRMKCGAVISMGWPTPAMFAGRTMRSVFITDLDRKPVIKEGSIYLLALNRVRAFMSRGLVVVESTPSEDLPQNDPYSPQEHDAPPVNGIFSIYNSGDRARWYMRCPECGSWFLPLPGPEGFWIPEPSKSRTLDDRANACRLTCTANGCGIDHKHKNQVVRNGVWVREGQQVSADGQVTGETKTTDIASFWLPGHAAAFQTWPHMIRQYLQALESLEASGNSNDLKVSLNTNFGCAFQLPRATTRFDDPSALAEREEPIARGVCPEFTRLIVTTIDIQVNRFVVQVSAWGELGECMIIDRFSLRLSNRIDGETGKPHPADPRTYLEDWAMLTDEVILKTYYSADKKLEFQPVIVGCDAMGGLDTTVNIALYYQQLRARNLHKRFMPVRGTGRLVSKMISTGTLTEKETKDKFKTPRDVPLLTVNVNRLKDTFFNNICREEPGPNFIHFGEWTPPWLYAELFSEAKGADGIYTKKKQRTNNEALDLFVYSYAILDKKGYFRINWNRPPYWAIPRKAVDVPKKDPGEDKKPAQNVNKDFGRFNRNAANK